ncbi:MAG: hypothetical protein Q8N63_02755 [Nanoarchaeota archaeon]|nr:hypothetical protein [Nanoarchaeota archaeon]
MAPIIRTTDERAVRILDATGVIYELVETPKQMDIKPVSEVQETPIDYQINPSDFIILEGKSGREGYPDLWVCKYRLGANPAVVSAGKQIGINIKNTAQEKNGREYIGDINRERALKLNLVLGGRTLNTRPGKDFFALLLSGKAFDGKGKRVSKTELSQIADEIMGVRDPYRDEWFGDYFTGEQDSLILNKNYVLKNNVLVPEYSHNLTACLMEDRTPGINLKSWLENSTAQGFPKKNIKSGELYYWHPEKDKAVRFGADSGDALLSCDRYPQSADARLGVRHVREAHAQKN